MIRAGYPVESLFAEVNGSVVEVGLVFQWVSGKRLTGWDVPRSQFDLKTVQRVPLSRVALHRAQIEAKRRALAGVKR
jgi:hypothetical protein